MKNNFNNNSISIILGLIALVITGLVSFFIISRDKITNQHLPIILIIIALILIFGIIAIFAFKNKEKKETDYRALFAIGVTWLALGPATDNYALSIMGIVFLIVGIKNKDKWKEQKGWKDFTREEKRLKLIFISILSFTIIAGIITLFIAKN